MADQRCGGEPGPTPDQSEPGTVVLPLLQFQFQPFLEKKTDWIFIIVSVYWKVNTWMLLLLYHQHLVQSEIQESFV